VFRLNICTMKIRDIIERTQAERKADAGVEHDQFFTRPAVAKQFADWVKSHNLPTSRVIEPAAGNMDLARYFPGIEMFDLDPKSPDIKQQDFFTADHKPQAGFLTVMNPPFGRGSDLAIRFFNKAVEFSDYIAQIVPRTFRRASVQNRLHQNFTLVDEYVLPRNSFYLPAEGPDRGYDVPAVAQIWKRTNQLRSVAKPAVTTAGVQYVADPAQADFAFRRKGRSAGQIITQDFAAANPNSFFFVRGDVTPWTKIDWSQLGNDTLGARSIAKSDIAQALSK
jgi:hypothetical protein